MIKEILYKVFGLEPMPCNTCEVLRAQLDESNRERRELLNRFLDRDKPEVIPSTPKEEYIPITPAHIPWRVRQQILEAEDRKAASLIQKRAQEINELEKELGVNHDLDRAESGGLKVEMEK